MKMYVSPMRLVSSLEEFVLYCLIPVRSVHPDFTGPTSTCVQGGLREHDCVRPFILVLISAVAEGTAEDQALGLIALQRTLSKRRPLVERFVRWGGLKVRKRIERRPARGFLS